MKKIIKAGKAILFAKIFKQKIPLYVSLKVTNSCNSNCKYCAIMKRKQKELTTTQILKLIEEMHQNGTSWLSFNGGEALVRDDISLLIRFAKSKGMFVSLFSNGYLVPRKINLIKKIDCLALSFDGKKEHHDLNREKGSYDKVMKAIKLVKKKTKVRLITNTVITKHNLHDIDFILKKAKEYGFFCKFNLLYKAKKKALQCTRMMPTNEEYSTVIDKLIKEKKKGAPIILSFNALRYLQQWNDYQKYYATKKKEKNFECFGGKLFCYIDTEGSVSACNFSKKFKQPLNAIETGFRQAFLNIESPSCSGCICSTCLGYNSILSFDADAILSGLKLLLK